LVAWQHASQRVAQQPRLDLSFGETSRRHVVAQLFPLRVDAGEAVPFGIQLHDVTADRTALRARDELIAMIGHELASPATSLLTLADILATRERTASERREMHGLMLAEGHRLIKLIRDLRTIPHLERTPFVVAQRRVDPGRLLEHAIAVAMAAHTNHQWSLDIPDVLPLVNADPARVQQVLANLISNAQKYSPDGGQVRISARNIGETIEVSVSDQGLGIPDSEHARIFDKFFRGDGRQRRIISGIGLGLAICKDIVEAHGGQIGFESAETGPGSRFWFTLPVAPALSPLIPEPTATLPEQRSAWASTGGLRVLVVEDDAAIGRMVTLILQADTHHVVAVASGEEALAQLRLEEFDVVLSDLGIGLGIDGLELCALVRSGWPELRFVLATGSLTVDPDEARALGVDDLLTKPFLPSELRRIIAGSDPRVCHPQAA
jgi:signal transduction histidine kinase